MPAPSPSQGTRSGPVDRGSDLLCCVARTEAAPGWVHNTGRSGIRAPAWIELWNARELIGFFALRDLKVRYKQAVLGVAWVLLQPIAMVAAFTLVFDHLADVGSQGLPYPLFALTGLVTWSYFAGTVSRAITV